MSGFHLGGAVPLASTAYVARRFERDTRAELDMGRWVLLLGPRQHGKSSGLLRIRKDLRSCGVRCALVDLQAMPLAERLEDAVSWFCTSVAHDLEVGESSRGSRNTEILPRLEALPTGEGRVVIIVDEAAAIENARLRDNFYGQLRAISNRRALASATELSARLSCVFAGTFRPERLVDDPKNSPLNVCERVETDDLTSTQAAALWRNVTGQTDSAEVTDAFGLVGGQPFLLQRIFDRLLRVGSDERALELERVTASLGRGTDAHLTGLFRRIREEPALVALAERLVDGPIEYVPADLDLQHLEVLGFASRLGEQAMIRNALYDKIARALIGGSAQLEYPSIGRTRP